MSGEKSTNQTKRAVYELRQQIINGDLAGGTRLLEVAMADALNISRTPVREAMSRLAEEGLLDRAPGGGFMVRSFTEADVHDAIELRGVLEGTAARRAAEIGISDEDLRNINVLLSRLDDSFDTVRQHLDFDSYSELNAAFHDELARLSQSAVIAREIDRVTSLPFASPSAFVLGRSDRQAAYLSLRIAQAQHRAIVDAIARREGARAEALAREHARIALGNLESVRADEELSTRSMPGLSLIVD